jgi:hypothetical protein
MLLESIFTAIVVIDSQPLDEIVRSNLDSEMCIF